MIKIGMSTSSVYPFSAESAFRLAKEAGFDGMEIMITVDPVTQDATALRALSTRYDLPILSVHAPVLVFSQFVWGMEAVRKLAKSVELAAAVGAKTVVVHPPFRLERGYARVFESTVRQIAAQYGVELAVENMFPLRFGGLTVRAQSPSSDPVFIDCDAITLDFSHAALAGRDSLEFAMAMGDRLRHVHLTDGTVAMGEGKLLDDEHLVPGHGTQPVAEVLQYLATRKWNGSLIAEVNTRLCDSDDERLAMLRETRDFAVAQLKAGNRARMHRSARVS
ncbi:MAG: sugar phosphate isomerase/epimerase [Salinibacterium sp.]|nr:sugar phosphate isomerase/epimerase [Salinibacterium sp.]